MNDVKVGDWVVNEQVGTDLTVGKQYKVHSIHSSYIEIIDDVGDLNEIYEGEFTLAPQKYTNSPREEYRELCEAWLRGEDIEKYFLHSDIFISHIPFDIDTKYQIAQPVNETNERKERIKQQLLKIDADKLAQLIIDAGIEL